METPLTGPGFGFLPGVVIDQHFTQRKRADRLRPELRSGEPGHRWVAQHVAFMLHNWSAEVDGNGSRSTITGGAFFGSGVSA